jgi:NTE family protein
LRSSIRLGLVLLIPALLQSQATSVPRQRIGLALSGGGALGLAHVGVLKYFEAHHIPVDAIAGTSMGGLVAGFYATGLNAAQLEQVTRSVPWDDMLRTTPKYDDLPIAEKQNWNRANANATLKFQRNLSLPAGLNSGQPLALLLSRYTAAYADLKSFDELPIPFRCVATDLTTSDGFTLQSGSLPLALRATMAIPGVFTPVTWQKRILVDGGAVDNIPVDVVRTMKPDVVIAVSLEVAAGSPKTLTSLTGVLRQVVNVVVIQNERRSLQNSDLVIAVPLQKFESTDYEQAQKIVDLGYQAAESMSEKLKPFQLDDVEWQEYLRQRESRVRHYPEKGRIIAVESSHREIEKDAERELRRKLPGTTDRGKLEDTLTGITAATSLPAAFYAWQNQSANEGYRVTLQERPSGGEVLIRPSLTMLASGAEPTRTSLSISMVSTPKDAYKSRILAEGSIGYDPGIRAEYYKPIGGLPYFVAPGVFIQRTHVDAYNGGTITPFVRDRFAATLYAGVGTWRFVQWRLGLTGGYDRASKPVTANGITSDSTGFANPETTFLLDTQDSGVLPSRGTRVSGAAGYSVRAHSFPYFTARVSHFAALRPGTGVFAIGRGATSFGRSLGYYDQFTAGGFTDLSAFRLQEFHANTLALAGGGIYQVFPKLRISGWKPVLAAWYEAGRTDQGSAGWSTHQSSSIGIFGSTPLGPAGVALSADENGRLRTSFVFGRF